MNLKIFVAGLGMLCALNGVAADAPVSAVDLLKDVTVADGFDVTIFATPDQANYPVFTAAAPDGTLFVSSDKNGSLGRLPKMGRVVRLRDTHGTGHADEVKEFIADVDSPRGLVWDKDRLYLVHPPHLSVYIDKDGDGVADEEKVLVKNLAFTFSDRPADHTTNGLSIGVDGWLYIACGDFGFIEAEGLDGRKLQLRGGGVIRVRPDGTGLELYSYGTRNILEAAISPLLDGFTRDNTNDGDGWDIRFHHISGLEDHGYPKLFKFFADEHVKPIGEYGGGSGCGAVWIDEPGFPKEWNNLPYTCDWGPGPLFRHSIQAKGATFEEIEKPVSLVKVPKSTDADVDGLSHVYVSSWRNGVFSFSTPEVGFITRVSPKGFIPEPIPDFAKAAEGELLQLLESNSHRRRLEAQRELLRRGLKPTGIAVLRSLAGNVHKPIASRVAAVFALKQGSGVQSHSFLSELCGDPTIAAWSIRALADRWDQMDNIPFPRIIELGIKSGDARTRREAVTALARGGRVDLAGLIAPLAGDSDEVVAHTAVQALIRLKAKDAALALWDRGDVSGSLQVGALRVLQTLHEPGVVDALVVRLQREENPERQTGLCRALSRLYYREGEWKGDSWGTRPDTRGPYYQPEKWSESERIGGVLLDALNKADAQQAAAFSSEFARHRIKPGDAIGKLIAMAEKMPSVLPTLVRQLSMEEVVPPSAIDLLLIMFRDKEQTTFNRALAAIALTKTESDEVLKILFETLPEIPAGGDKSDLTKAESAFYNSPKLENLHQFFEELAASVKGDRAKQADCVLLKLARRNGGAPESRMMSEKALVEGWESGPLRKVQIMKAMSDLKMSLPALDLKVVKALDDPDKAVQAKAANVVKAAKLNPEKILAAALPSGPLISALKGEDVIKEVVRVKGDKSRGEVLFAQQGCVNCHTVEQGQALKGPYLGNIAQTYTRSELAEAILYPNKTIAQGFVTNVFVLKDGSTQMGFVVQESADKVSIRNVAGQEVGIETVNVASRAADARSLMPEGLLGNLSVKEFASLLDYLSALSIKVK